MRRLGLGLMVVGGVLALAGVALLLGDRGSDATAAPSSPNSSVTVGTQAPATTAITTTPASTAGTPATTGATVPATTTTTTTAATTTTMVGEAFDAFMVLFRQALDGDDVEFLLARLHPQVAAAYGEDLCRGFVAGEVVELNEYQTTGDLDGPTRRTLDAGGTAVTLDGVYDVDVSFVFQGQAFGRAATFVLEGGTWFWVGQCR